MATFAPRGWRLVRLGGGSEPRLGAIDPAAPAGRARAARARPDRSPAPGTRRRRRGGRRRAHGRRRRRRSRGLPLLAPLAPEEIWAAGVTYERSRSARVEESESAADVYDRVYEAERPEIFLKDAGCRRTVGPNEPVGVRSESTWTVPEAGARPGARARTARSSRSSAATTSRRATSRPPTRSTSRRPSSSPRAVRSARRFSCPTIPARRSRSRCASGTRPARSSTRTARAPPKLHRSLEELAGWCVRENPVPDGRGAAHGHGNRAAGRGRAGARLPRRGRGRGDRHPRQSRARRLTCHALNRGLAPIERSLRVHPPHVWGLAPNVRSRQCWVPCWARPKRSGSTATASISTFMPGTGSSRTPTSVLAGRDSPKKAWRSGLISGRSSTSVR